MKRIEFIAPVEAMRGNLSGNQDLKYPTQNNKAFESPEGSVNYARNYSTRFIGAKRASDGLKYFAVKTKTATHITPRSLMAMALLGGAGAMYAALVRVKTSTTYANIYAQWVELQNYGSTKTFRQYVMDNFRQALASKASVITLAGPRGSITVNNPWVAADQTPDVAISSPLIAKFWAQLAIDGITFDVAGTKGIANTNDTFENVLSSTKKNVLNLSSSNVGPTTYVKYSNQYLKYEGEYVTETDAIVPNGKYTLTDIQPPTE